MFSSKRTFTGMHTPRNFSAIIRQMSAFSQKVGKCLHQIITSAGSSLIQLGTLQTLALANPDGIYKYSLTPSDVPVNNLIKLSDSVSPLGTKYMTLHVLLSYTNGAAVASLPVVIPQVSVTIHKTPSPNKIFLYPFTNTFTVGTSVWATTYVTIPVDRTLPSCCYTVSITPIQSSTTPGVTNSSITTINVAGAYLTFLS
jgi:hypothetical protein